VRENEMPGIEASITDDMKNRHNYFDMGSSGLIVLLHYLVERPEMAELTAQILNKTTFPGYGYFIDQGETTWPEDWKINVPSKIHTCFTGIASWFVKGLCGIMIDEANPGYKHFIIRPMIVAETDFAEACIMSPYGKIESRWKRNDDELTMWVTVPPNSSATIHIPAVTPGGISEGGHPLDRAEGITLKGMEKGCMVVDVGAGTYVFRSI
jgi:alpha-L-rhamnosidase